MQESPLQRFLSRLEGVRSSGQGYMARCPAHPDHNPSLSIRESQDGRVLFTCHAGCDSQVILEQLQLCWRDLAPSKPPEPSERTYTTQEIRAWPWTQAVYEYQDPARQPLFLVVRMQSGERKKSFVQYRAQGPGEWRKGLGAIQTVLYRLPELLEARAGQNSIFLVEGEKDVETLRSLGLTATCNPGGAGKWREHFQEVLRGARVVILADNDEVGRNHARGVARALHPLAAEVKLLEQLPGLPPKGDITDWLALGHTPTELQHLVETTSPWQVVSPRLPSPAPLSLSEQLHLTDLGNAQRLVRDHGTDLRYCHPWQRWLVWDGRRWQVDQTAEVIRKAKDTIRSIYGEAAQITEDRQRQATADHARRSEAHAKIKAMVASAESEPGIPVLPERLDAHPWLLNCLNGTLDLRTGQLHAHRREDLLTKLISVPYEPQALCPTWEAFLDQVLGHNRSLVHFLQRAVGYSLTSETREHCLFFLYGTGRNGKSTFLECLYSLLGDYAQKADFSTFLERKGDSIRNDLACLKGCRFLSASETSEGRRLDEALVKDLTGGETITARHLYGEFFDFKPQFKLFLSANHKPPIRGTDEGIWSRIRLIPFTLFLSPEQRDPRLSEKLQAEFPGILAWAVRGCLEWQAHGLKEPQEVQRATRQYREEMDPLLHFLNQCCRIEPEATATAKALFENYLLWCQHHGEEAISQKAFGCRLAERGFGRFRSRVDGTLLWLWSGVALRPVV